jgi:hypothetical protein
MLFIVAAVWIVATVITFTNGRGGFGLFSLLVGGLLVYSLFTGKVGYPGLAALAILAVILVITNKFDMR